MSNKKVVIGMSGGVDSSVAAYILKEQGYDVIGVTMKTWDDSVKKKIEGGCCSLSATEDARMVANKIDIPFYVMNFVESFKELVIDYFIEEYGKGRTPNPCIACNRYVKFEELLRRARALGCEYVATGHYARIEYNEETGRYILKKAKATKKDQTYALYAFTQEQLKHTLMPLGEYDDKEAVREIARKLDLVVADKGDSQEICFVEDDDYGRYLEENADYEIKPGNFVDLEGKVLGRHKGIVHYTIGQRKGLGIALGKPAYVVEINAKRNEVVIGGPNDVFGTELIAEDINLISVAEIREPMRVCAKVRYSAKEQPATLYPIGTKKLKVVFDEPVRAITKGQAVVFYDGDVVVGGGTIQTKVK